MDILWERGELSASEVGTILLPKRHLARNTVRTLLLRMEEKGWLTHREVGRAHRYSPAVPREATIGKKVIELIDTLCGGSPEALMSASWTTAASRTPKPAGFAHCSTRHARRTNVKAEFDSCRSSRTPLWSIWFSKRR